MASKLQVEKLQTYTRERLLFVEDSTKAATDRIEARIKEVGEENAKLRKGALDLQRENDVMHQVHLDKHEVLMEHGESLHRKVEDQKEELTQQKEEFTKKCTALMAYVQKSEEERAGRVATCQEELRATQGQVSQIMQELLETKQQVSQLMHSRELEKASRAAVRSVKLGSRYDGRLHQTAAFEVQVVMEPGTSFAVMRRYSEFLELEAALRPRFPDLPSMPPRSYFRRRSISSFLDARQKRLGDLLDAAVAADPSISVPALRAFLGLEGLEKDSDSVGTDDCADLEESADSASSTS